VTWRLRGSAYSHGGACAGTTCEHCYKYTCAHCGERSNRMMTCGFCNTAGDSFDLEPAMPR